MVGALELSVAKIVLKRHYAYTKLALEITFNLKVLLRCLSVQLLGIESPALLFSRKHFNLPIDFPCIAEKQSMVAHSSNRNSSECTVVVTGRSLPLDDFMNKFSPSLPP
jgi:hypothetical protein